MQTDKCPLTQDDLQSLRNSFATQEIVEKAGLFRVPSDVGQSLVGNSYLDCSGIAYPYRNPVGQIVAYAIRRDNPDEGETGKVKRKYLYEKGFRNNLYYATNVVPEDLQNVDMPLAFSEGPKKCLALERMQTEGKKHFRAMSLAGVHNIKTSSYKTANASGQRIDKKDIIADLKNIKFSDGDRSRLVYIVFDSNCRKEINPSVFYARIKFAQLLRHRGATVHLVDLPQVEGVNGIDDLLGFYEKESGAAAAIEKVWLLFDQAVPFVSATNFIITDNGVFYRSASVDKDGNKQTENQFICSKLEIIAKTRDEHGSNWGRLLQWEDDDGRGHQWAMPMASLSGDGSEVRRRLFDEGLLISSHRKAQVNLSEYLQTYETFQKITCVSRIGWYNDAYVFPNETINHSSAMESIVYQAAYGGDHKFETSGTMAEWQEGVSRFCPGNSRLIFAVSAAFASPLLPVVKMQGGGFHFRGPTSIGKTTVLHVGGSVWGGSKTDEHGYLQTWKGTSNGVEAVAASHNHALLCLDEISECDSREIGNVSYMLANGRPKTRMTKTLQTRKSATWNLLFLSSGEQRLADKMLEAGQRIKGGQDIRLCDIEADTGKFGLFETLHGFKSGHELSDHLRDASKKYYGTSIRDFLRWLVNTDIQAISANWNAVQSKFIKDNLPEDKNFPPEVYRVVSRFALVAMAGELATSAGITGWAEGAATAGVVAVLESWLAGREGDGGQTDAENAIRQVRAFLEAHGQSRFQNVDSTSGFEEKIVNRAGFKRKNPVTNEIEFLILPESFRNEVCKGFEAKLVANALADRGFLIKGGDGKFLRNAKCGELGQKKIYQIASSIFEQDAEAND
jgi:uncharacterized protein (DUF927 family)